MRSRRRKGGFLSRFFALLAAAFGGVIIVSAAVFSATLDLSPLDALYFVVTTITTVGYGDFNLRDAPDALKLYGIVLMLMGSAFIGVFLGFITDRVVSFRIDDLMGKRRKKMTDHIIVCGLGQLGFRIAKQLTDLGHRVLAIECDSDSRFIRHARHLGIQVVEGDSDSSVALDEAFVSDARALVACTDDDLVNLKTTARARAIKPDIHIVLRMFDQDFADKIEDAFNIGTAFSSTAIAAPTFAMAAIDPGRNVISVFEAGGDTMLTIRTEVGDASRLAGMSVEDIRARHAVHPVSVEREGRVVAMGDAEAGGLRVGDLVTLVGIESGARCPARLTASFPTHRFAMNPGAVEHRVVVVGRAEIAVGVVGDHTERIARGRKGVFDVGRDRKQGSGREKHRASRRAAVAVAAGHHAHPK